VRVLCVNDGIGDAGGVQNYLAAILPALAARGHAVALLHVDRLRRGHASPAPAGTPHFCLETDGAAAVEAALAWRPDVAFSHNFRPLDVEARLLAALPVVKMMHGYAGTCVGGQKAHLSPRPVPCGRALGPACLALFVPRRCGPRDPRHIVREWRWARRQQALFPRYAALVTASGHVRDAYVRSGAPAERAVALPLFPTLHGDPGLRPPPPEFRVAFLGRMTHLKGGAELVRAVAAASARAGRPLALTLAGDGPQRAAWEALARRLGVDAEWVGWVDDAERVAVLRRASVLAVPSVWPEPFGLVGVEAGLAGVPAVAFDVGGVGEWLTDGVNGFLAPGDPPAVEGLADALVLAQADPDRLARMGAAAREVALHLSRDRHVAALERVLGSPAP
jgi:glycosyltransferase involved in cell wall biosynthesis